MPQIPNVLLPPPPPRPFLLHLFPAKDARGRDGEGGKRGQDKQVEKGSDFHSRKTKIILGGVGLEDSVEVRLGPIKGAKQFNSAGETALSVSRFPAADGGRSRNSRCWRRCSLSVAFYALRYGTLPSGVSIERSDNGSLRITFLN